MGRISRASTVSTEKVGREDGMSLSAEVVLDVDCDECGMPIDEHEQVYCESCHESSIGAGLEAELRQCDLVRECANCHEEHVKQLMYEKLKGYYCRKCATVYESELTKVKSETKA